MKWSIISWRQNLLIWSFSTRSMEILMNDHKMSVSGIILATMPESFRMIECAVDAYEVESWA